MRYDSSTTGDHVSLLINHPDLPDDEQLYEAILDNIEAAVADVLADHGVEADGLYRPLHRPRSGIC